MKPERAQEIKREVIEHYGGKCECCGETTFEFLAIDHVGGDGNRLRKAGEAHGAHLAVQLKVKNYPEGYRILCYNCNSALGWLGYCPHHMDVRVPRPPASGIRGSRHGEAKLTEGDVIQIRTRYDQGGIFYRELAEQYGVSGTTICRVVRRELWCHV
jgi:hypothetical protein